MRALKECRRVLKKGGVLAYTIPIVYGRMSRTCEGRKKSFHGDPNDGRDDYLVITEYGADFWVEVIRAGFMNINIKFVKRIQLVSNCCYQKCMKVL